MYHPLKRVIDCVVSLFLLLLLAPLFLILALLIRINLGSPVFFRQKRAGLQGKLFTIVKFRSMTDDREQDESLQEDHLRMTRLGNFLRSTSMDELPELFNVLKGDMSLVGPRPLLPIYLERYNEHQARRHDVMPGMTGWAQVNGRNSLDWNDKFQKDVWYVDHCSLLLDIKIIFLTIFTLIKKDDITYAGHASMPEFTGNELDSNDSNDKG